MQYTKDNITGLKFTYNGTGYTILSVEENSVKMVSDGYENNPFLDVLSNTLEFLNDGTWIVTIPKENNYAIY